ncbi:MAG: protein translocase subunit SecD [Planctomycetes bacterium]|nr:protein translocase subunit SecD [Planctomycetota bacterium]
MDGFGHCLLLLQAEAEAPPAANGWLILGVLAAVFIAPYLLGQLLGRALRLNDLSGRIGVVLMSIFMALAPFVYQEISGRLDEAKYLAEQARKQEEQKKDKVEATDAIPTPPYVRRTWRDAVHWGIDLAGGTNLVYEIDLAAAKAAGKPVDKATVDKMVEAIKKRINPSGAEEVNVRRVGTDRIEVIIPGADKDLVEQKKALIVRLGSLEFGIVATERNEQALIEQATKLPPEINELRRKVGDVEVIVAAWHDVVDPKNKDKNEDEAEERDSPGIRHVMRRDPKTGKEIRVKQMLIKHDPPNRAVTGAYLTNAKPTRDNDGAEAVAFSFNARGAALFHKLTSENLPDKSDGFKRQLAILLDGKVHSAPVINDVISSNGQISGQFTRAEIDSLVGVLNAGALDVPLKPQPVSEFTISPLLGIDVQQKGITAILVSAAAVFVFMLIYYLVSGVIADLCLALNLLLVVGAMAFISATFTLPGLAGLVLTIGMAVDSNVLIYERIREELARGMSLRMAIQNGFDKALAAIIDSNVTTLITAVILYLIGSDLIKGFAVSLFIGLMVSLFSCLYFGHLCFHILERKRWVTSLKMLQFLGETKIDFLSKRMSAYLFSATLIAVGLIALFVRGAANMDIDFSGGRMVTFEFVEPQATADVRSRLEKQFKDGISLERLTLANEEASAARGQRFRVRTIEQDENVVADNINNAFEDPSFALRRVTLDEYTVGDVTDKLTSDQSRFVGGRQASLKFTGSMSEATVVDYLSKQLADLKVGNAQPKYDGVQLLLSARGTKAAEEKTLGKASPKFTEFSVLVAKEVENKDLDGALQQIQATLAKQPLFEEVNAFDTSVANETKTSALLAITASLIMIIIYIWFRFEKVYFGFAAVAALAHDVLVTLGCIALGAYLSKTPIGAFLMLEDFKINMPQIACLLTIVGYSLNDTIVIFDRIREIKGKSPRITYDMINLSVNQTLSRTILTALTVFIVVVVLYLLGGEGIHGFAFSMIIGVLTGAYSTIYIANPVLFWLVDREGRLHPKKA